MKARPESSVLPDMGIQGLLQNLKPYVEPVHVSKYSGQRVSTTTRLHSHCVCAGREFLYNLFTVIEVMAKHLE